MKFFETWMVLCGSGTIHKENFLLFLLNYTKSTCEQLVSLTEAVLNFFFIIIACHDPQNFSHKTGPCTSTETSNPPN